MLSIINKLIFLALFFPGLLFSQIRNVEITTQLKKNFTDKEGNPLTGKGVTIGDVDSGIDIFNPMFFYPDGGEFSIIDVDNNGVFTPGKDVVDLNGNGKADKNEMLGYIEMSNGTYTLLRMDPKEYNSDMDFLFLDLNGNGIRDYGTENGFTENDPTYGEQIFISEDLNKNNILDKDEKVIALKTSKVKAIREKDGTVRRRGIDLIEYAERDSAFGHGTSVAGMLLGGTPGFQKIHGIAPDAEIVVAIVEYDYTPRFAKHFPDLVRFIKDENADILLFEDGEWGWESLDGSTEEEMLVSEYAREGMTIIGGAGNLAGNKMHIKDTLSSGEENTYSIKAPITVEGKKNNGVFVSFLWNNSKSDITFEIETPDKKITLPFNSGSEFLKTGGYNIFYSKEVTSKETAKMMLGFSGSDSGAVNGEWKIKIKPDNDIVIDGFVVDVSQSWAGSTHWTSTEYITDESTITFPCTADSIISVGAYAVNYGWNEKVGELASYSPRGYLVTGRRGIDITAPGHSTFSTGLGNSYVIFSGTSAAAPHVTGAAALMLQYDPALTHSQIKEILLKTATADSFTGDVPNADWGYGKLNIEKAINYLINNNN
ncbi:MAG TPA: S8 family serine peptidase [Ignavibacteria bacterium]|nr:S8 family serine peptidase [Ignavibacteria bacterium]